jgi:endothelin-converting enzyme
MKITTDHFTNMVEYNRFKYNTTWAELTKPADLNRWQFTMPTADGGYDPIRNELTFPAGDMQLPGFAFGLPEYVSYGGFGSTAANDIAHAWDRNGSKYDEKGHGTTGWDAATSTNFDKKAKCFVDQYSKYTIPGATATEKIALNGTVSLAENVADAAGLAASFTAWQKRNAKTPNPSLPGLEKYSNEQLFFLSFATSWCGKRKVEDNAKALAEPHSPSRYRILGSLANSKDFKKAFNCPVKTATCESW